MPYLPVRFGIDKRKAHYSNLIASGQITKEEAVQLMKEPLYKTSIEEDRNLIMERFDLNENTLHTLLTAPIRNHEDFRTEKKSKALYHNMKSFLKPVVTLRTSPTY